MKRFSLLAALLLATVLVACEESSVNPVGSGTELKATVNGAALTFPLNTDAAGAPAYDASTHHASFSGTIVGTTSRTISLSFISDISTSSYPRTLGESDAVQIIYVETAGTAVSSYACSIPNSDCRVTLTGSDGNTADGTFQATLRDPNDTSRVATVVDGRFSVKLR